MKSLRMDSDELRQDLVPIIAGTIMVAIIIIVYNFFKYITMEAPESIPYKAIQLTSASVIISDRAHSSTGNAVERKNVCVLSKGEYITNADAIKVALGENQKYYTGKNYHINVIRPCGKQASGYASVPAVKSLKA